MGTILKKNTYDLKSGGDLPWSCSFTRPILQKLKVLRIMRSFYEIP